MTIRFHVTYTTVVEAKVRSFANVIPVERWLHRGRVGVVRLTI